MPRSFQLTQWDDRANMSSLRDEIMLTPTALVSAFGDPEESDGHKVSGEYVFEEVGNTDNVFTLYDWKATTMYDSELWRPSELWASKVAWDFHVGGKDDDGLEDFKAWLQQQVVAADEEEVPCP